MDRRSEDNSISLVPVVDLDDDSHPPSNSVVSLLNDDDDLEIVETSIRHRLSAPFSSFLVDDADIQVVDPPNTNDEVQAVTIVKTSRAPTLCASCSSDLTDDTFTVSRCKHALCVSCALRCVGALYPNEQSSEETLTPNFDVLHLKSVPMCIVKRCRAPLSPADSDLALAPLETDQYFARSLSEFKHWKNDDVASIAGPSPILFPDFTSEMAAEALLVNGDEGEGELFDDDFAGAFDPLWLWDADFYCGNGTTGAWICAACGMYHHSSSSSNSAGHSSTAFFDFSVIDSETAIPDHPLYPHCDKARAFGLMECIRRLSEVDRDNEPGKAEASKPTTRASTRRGRGKRYKTARSVQALKRRRVTGFAKGTGYAGRVGAEWQGTSAKILEKTARVDAATAFWLCRIRCFILRTADVTPSAWPGHMRLLLRECKLTEHLAKILINESIMDVGERVPVYVAALRVATALCDSPSLRRLVGEPNDGNEGRSVASLINSLSKQAALLTTGVGNDNLCSKTKLLIRQIRKAIRGVNRYKLLREMENRTGTHPLPTCPKNPAFLDRESISGGALGVQTEHGGSSDETDEKSAVEKRKRMYISAMKELQFETVQGLANASAFRNEIGKASASTVGRGQAMRRIASEVATLYSSLPLSWSSTILLRVDEDRYDFLRACVFGPEDTPYECGAFLFDIFLPSTYPQSPPKFKLLTTGGGRVRFNPNLYANGKVCLSLLGTWSGPSWTPASTLLQVLVSIQSLIMVPEPYFNEPGLERTIGTAAGTRQSETYNQRVRTGTANVAILDALRNPYNEFRVAIQTHFRLKRVAVEHILRKWFGYSTEKTPRKEDEEPLAVAEPNLMMTGQSVLPGSTNMPNIFGVTSGIPVTSSHFAASSSAIVLPGLANTVAELEALTSPNFSAPIPSGNMSTSQTANSNLLSLASQIPGMWIGHGHNGSALQAESGTGEGELSPVLESEMLRPDCGSVDTVKVARSIIAELDKL